MTQLLIVVNYHAKIDVQLRLIVIYNGKDGRNSIEHKRYGIMRLGEESSTDNARKGPV